VPTSLCSSYEQSRKQSAASITLFDLNDGIHGDTFVCATSRNFWPFDTLAFFLLCWLYCTSPIMYRFFGPQKYVLTNFYSSQIAQRRIRIRWQIILQIHLCILRWRTASKLWELSILQSLPKDHLISVSATTDCYYKFQEWYLHTCCHSISKHYGINTEILRK